MRSLMQNLNVSLSFFSLECREHHYLSKLASVLHFRRLHLKAWSYLLFDLCPGFVASLWLKNERGEMLSSHRSDHMRGAMGGLHSLCNVQRNFPHLWFSTSSTLLPTLPPLYSNCYNAFLLNMQVFLSFNTNFLVGIWCCDKSINLLYSFFSSIFVLS